MDASDSSSGSITVKAPEYILINSDHVRYAFEVLHDSFFPQAAAATLPFEDARCPVGELRVYITWTKPGTADARTPTSRLQAKPRGSARATSRQLSLAIRDAALATPTQSGPIQLEELPELTCTLELLQNIEDHLGRDGPYYQRDLHGLLLEAPVGNAHPHYNPDEEVRCECAFLKEAACKRKLEDNLREYLKLTGHPPNTYFSTLRCATIKTFTTSSCSASWNDFLEQHGFELVQDERQRVQNRGANSQDAEYEFVRAHNYEDENGGPDDGSFVLVEHKSAILDDADADDDGDYELAKTQSR